VKFDLLSPIPGQEETAGECGGRGVGRAWKSGWSPPINQFGTGHWPAKTLVELVRLREPIGQPYLDGLQSPIHPHPRAHQFLSKALLNGQLGGGDDAWQQECVVACAMFKYSRVMFGPNRSRQGSQGSSLFINFPAARFPLRFFQEQSIGCCMIRTLERV